MNIIVLARHGSHSEVDKVLSGRSSIGLNVAGRAEAGRLATRLAAVPLIAIHSSPRRRALETAEVVARSHAMEVQLADALDEIDFGAWSGRSFGDLDQQPDWSRWNSERGSAATPAGETMASVTARASAHIRDIAGRGAVLCVTHCDVIRGLVVHYLGLGYERMLSFACDPGSLTTLAPDGVGARLITLNECPQ